MTAIAFARIVATLTVAALIGNTASARVATLAIVGGTVIDGTGAAPVPDATVLVAGTRIVSVGPRHAVSLPPGTRIVDASGLYLIPGFIDVNAHVSVYSGHEAMVRYEDRFVDIAVETAQRNLQAGVTTIRDSYGLLPTLAAARQIIASGKVAGSRLLVAGNVIGWGGPWSMSAPGPPMAGQALTLFQERMNDAFTQGVGEELIFMPLGSLRPAIEAYLDKGPDFLKYGATVHSFEHPFLLFSESAQRVIVDAAHRRGVPVDVHAGTVDALRAALDAGVDLVQHPEIQADALPEDLVLRLARQQVICAIHANMITGPLAPPPADRPSLTPPQPRSDRPMTGAEARRARRRGATKNNRANATRLIQAGCRVAVASDSLAGPAPEFDRGDRSPWTVALEPGAGTLSSIEGLVELGMRPMGAIVAATSNGAIAARLADSLGTIEPGKIADFLLLRANPLLDIANIRALHTVVKEGAIVDIQKLPTRPTWTADRSAVELRRQ